MVTDRAVVRVVQHGMHPVPPMVPGTLLVHYIPPGKNQNDDCVLNCVCCGCKKSSCEN